MNSEPKLTPPDPVPVPTPPVPPSTSTRTYAAAASDPNHLLRSIGRWSERSFVNYRNSRSVEAHSSSGA